MKKLSGALANTNTNKKKSSTLIKGIEVEQTVPRKISEADYNFIREYAFKKNYTMLEATEKLYVKIREKIEKQTTSIINIKEEADIINLKSIRLSMDFNKYLKEVSHETKIPMRSLLSYFIQYFKKDMESEYR